MASHSPKFWKMNPLPDYVGPRPVYGCSFPWAGSVPCLVRFNPTACKGGAWETAPHGPLAKAEFSLCPVASASMTRHAAVMAFDYYYNRKESDQ